MPCRQAGVAASRPTAILPLDLPDDEGAFGMALRQTTGFVESLLRLAGLGWTVPDFSTLSRRQKTLAVNIPYRGSKGPLNLLIDSAVIKVEGEGGWHARKHGGPKRRVWRKIHLGIDEETLEIRTVEITRSHFSDGERCLACHVRFVRSGAHLLVHPH